MEKIIPCNRQKYRNSKTANNIRNKHNRMVLAEGLEPMDTQGIRMIRLNFSGIKCSIIFCYYHISM